MKRKGLLIGGTVAILVVSTVLSVTLSLSSSGPNYFDLKKPGGSP